MITLIIASTNKKKKQELKAMLKGLRAQVLCIDEACARIPVVIEDGKTFVENAVKKALTYSRVVDGLVLADDSGIEVKAIGMKPGVRSARFAGKGADDAKNNAKLLKALDGLPMSKRVARFVCVIALAQGGRLVKTVRGTCGGKIAFEPRGHNGFGYDPLFIPSGKKLTYAGMPQADKHRISHRGRALERVKRFLSPRKR